MICDDVEDLRDERFGEEEMVEYGSICFKHWWFEGWNARAAYKQREKWPVAMAKSLEVSETARVKTFCVTFEYRKLKC